MRSVKTTWKHIRRSPYQSLSAILITTITFFTISFFVFILFASSTIINFLESQLQVVAFFKDESRQTEINELIKSVKSSGMAEDVKFVSKKDAFDKYRAMNKNNPILLELVTEDILPASLEISSRDTKQLPSIARQLETSPLVSEVKYERDVVTKFSQWVGAIRTIGLGLIGILAIESVLIIVSILGFKISQKKEEIEIMKLLSATNWYIRWPFILEGIFYAVLGTLLGWLLAIVFLMYLVPKILPFLADIPIMNLSNMFLAQLLMGELTIAFIIGIFASSVAVLRYLK